MGGHPHVTSCLGDHSSCVCFRLGLIRVTYMRTAVPNGHLALRSCSSKSEMISANSFVSHFRCLGAYARVSARRPIIGVLRSTKQSGVCGPVEMLSRDK